MIALYIDWNGEPLYIDLMRGGCLSTLWIDKVINNSYHNFQLLVGEYFIVKQKYIQHFHMITHAEYM